MLQQGLHHGITCPRSGLPKVHQAHSGPSDNIQAENNSQCQSIKMVMTTCLRYREEVSGHSLEMELEIGLNTSLEARIGAMLI